jgi:phosphotransferase system enzyme I (PtsI)
MFPMISCFEELEQALALLDEARAECGKKKQVFADNIDAGIMIEVPSAVITAGVLAERCAFFSIGTNDLTQYTLAVDRGNERVNYLNNAFHPALLRSIKHTIDEAHKKDIRAAVCGEFAADPAAAAILLGLGLDELSMTASSIPQVKQTIRETSLESCKALAAECLAGRSVKEITTVVSAWKAKS